MKSLGIVRKVDDLGRIVIPSELRRTMDIEPGDGLELFVDGPRIIFQKDIQGCTFCDETKDLHPLFGKLVCPKCVTAINRLLPNPAEDKVERLQDEIRMLQDTLNQGFKA